MVKLTDSHVEALALIGTGTLTSTQVASALDVFSASNQWVTDRCYIEGSLEQVSFVAYAHVDSTLVCIASTHSEGTDDIFRVTNMFLWSDLSKKLKISLTAGHDDYDYCLAFESDKKDVFGAFFFRLSRTPYEVID